MEMNRTLMFCFNLLFSVILYLDIATADCAQHDNYCPDKTEDKAFIEKKGIINWKKCGEMCFDESTCNWWYYYIEGKLCFMLDACNSKGGSNGKGNVIGEKSCPGPATTTSTTTTTTKRPTTTAPFSTTEVQAENSTSTTETTTTPTTTTTPEVPTTTLMTTTTTTTLLPTTTEPNKVCKDKIRTSRCKKLKQKCKKNKKWAEKDCKKTCGICGKSQGITAGVAKKNTKPIGQMILVLSYITRRIVDAMQIA